ncbi:hypothetical protein C5B91_20100 [Haloferax sp. Atlit-10N]|uniref:hypothetical protein n=1 Tax=unclassified Haloferax TaxID=2625095 RepID=UPI000E23AFF5|nr:MULTISPECIES: hypothetical protein [unclassified Haloferax]RDZ39399.1 hypothetical protein C5B87_19360 [Haloferax sp. Atlit-16N]RDZ53914.1 hypothetical protein C5B91_20100 [Haloferax sp. Atlit-10N]RLM40564.1 hypothetical protein DVK04_19410 [Haloferax sp. Atlit-105R]
MATSVPSKHTVDGSVDLDVDFPEQREYENAENAELDTKLVEAISAAQAAGNDHLEELLSLELGSHYYRTR